MAELVGPCPEEGEGVEEHPAVRNAGEEQAQHDGGPEDPNQLPLPQLGDAFGNGVVQARPIDHEVNSSWSPELGGVDRGNRTGSVPLFYDLAVDEICSDLEQEHAALDAIVGAITEDQWNGATAAEGWDVKDTIVHLIQADIAARIAATDAEGFQKAKAEMGSGGLSGVFGDKGDRSGAEILTWWRDEREQMLAAFRSRGPKDRIPWFGPDMSTLSFATARLMETWSHGQDIADAVGADWPPTDRLKHVAHIGVSTRGWSYVNRGEAVPDGDVRVELTAPSGDVWTWGPEGAADRITGPALDFCLVATQRRHPADTALVAQGPLAEGWLAIAQAFAGPPTLPQADRRS